VSARGALIDICTRQTIPSIARLARASERPVGVATGRVRATVVQVVEALVNVNAAHAVAGVPQVARALERALRVAARRLDAA